jgi:TP901 family phage tail tape measure protein
MAKRITYVFGADLSELERSWRKIEKNMQRLSRQMRTYGAAMTKAFTVPLAGIGSAASKAALDVEKAFSIIARGTGAQGQELKALEDTWRKMAGNVTQSFEESAQVLADYNTRLGLTGKTLAEVSEKALNMARMLGEDVGGVVAQSSKAIQDWGVDVQDAASFLDKLFVAAQQTGISVSKLSEGLYKYGSPMRALGFDIDTAIATLANFEKAGVNVELVLGALRQGLAKMAREGIPEADKAFVELLSRIRNAATDTEATRLAIETFGSRAGPDLAMAIREGRFSVDKLVESLQKADGVIDTTTQSTETFGEKWAKVKNKVLLALEPIGRQIMDVAEKAIPKIEGAVSSMAEKIAQMSDETKQKLLALAGVMAVGGPLLMAISAVVSSLSTLAGAFVALVSGPAAPIALTIAGIYALIKAYQDLDAVQKKVTGMTPDEALERNKYLQKAGEIFHPAHERSRFRRSRIPHIRARHGKYPVTAQDFEEVNKIIDELMPKTKEAQTQVGDLGKEIEESIRNITKQGNDAINTTTEEAIIPALTNIGEKTDELGKKAAEVRDKYNEMLDAIRIAEAEAAYAFQYEGGPMPMSMWKEQEWNNSELRQAQEIGRRVAATLEEAKQKTEEVGGAFDQLVTKSDMWAKSLTDGIADAIVQGRSLSSVLQQIAAQLAKMVLSKALTGLFGGFVSLFHEGGIVGEEGVRTKLPRYHSGGIVGSNEELAVLRKGEGVFTPGQMRALGSAGGETINVTMNINAIDARSVVEFFRGNKGMIESLVVESIHRDGTLRKVIKGLV